MRQERKCIVGCLLDKYKKSPRLNLGMKHCLGQIYPAGRPGKFCFGIAENYILLGKYKKSPRLNLGMKHCLGQIYPAGSGQILLWGLQKIYI